MHYVGFGLMAVITGMLLFVDGMEEQRWTEAFGLLVVAVGLSMVLIGMVVHVVRVNRADRAHQLR